MGNHSEAIQIDYDPEQISYEKLLEIYWDSHNPYSQSWSSQYRNIVFYHDEEQKEAAELSRYKLSSLSGERVKTEIRPMSPFFLAENYHQKYMLRNHYAVLSDFESRYATAEKLISSTDAARVNGYLGGNGTCDNLKAEINTFKLSESSKRLLLNEVCFETTGFTCPSNNCN